MGNNDKKVRTEDLLDIIQGDSCTGMALNIEELPAGNEKWRDLLLLWFYQNAESIIHNKINGVHKDIKDVTEKHHWHCEHEGCPKPGAYMHELSERAVLSNIADSGDKVWIIKPDLKTNSSKYVPDNIHISNASSFLGYCSSHAQMLFNYVDQPGMEVDLKYVNLQSMKMMKNHLFTLKKIVKFLSGLTSKLEEIISEDAEVTEEILQINDGKRRLKEMLNYHLLLLENARQFHERIWRGIQNQQYVIRFKIIPCYKTGWVFSQTMDLVKKGESGSFYSFIFKVDVNGQAVLVYAWSDDTVISEADILEITSNEIITVILKSKDKLVFSEDFLSNLNEGEFGLLLADEDVYSHWSSLTHRMIFKNILFGYEF